MKTNIKAPKVGAIASWFGSNRQLAHAVGKALVGCPWVGIVFAGGMTEAPYIDARSLFINDAHRHVINLADVARNRTLGPQLYRIVRRLPFSEVVLRAAQSRCISRESAAGLFGAEEPDDEALSWAVDYFVCSWMARHGSAGTNSEFAAPISLRYNANGGDSAAHYWGATRALVQWRRILQRANFTTLDFRDFLGKCKDEASTGIYSDSPFPDAGDGYKHKFTLKDHRDLADRLSGYQSARVVCRFYDHPLVRELYPETRWSWRALAGGKTQTNAAAPEVLICNQPLAVSEAA